MTGFTPEACDDAARDALALIRAALDDDTEATAVVAAHLSWPQVTAGILAGWLAMIMTELGITEDLLREWQQGAGLS